VRSAIEYVPSIRRLRSATAATSTIPVVFVVGSDPVRIGLVASLARPGGNAIGVNIFTAELAEKRFGLVNDAIPTATTFAVLTNPACQLTTQSQKHHLTFEQ
jgi:putative tryptophan/tyrosine transport system substrate-binding protein